MSALQRLFVDQIFPDKAQIVLESNSNIGEDNRKIAILPQRINSTMSDFTSSSPNKQKKTLNLQPVQHNIERQISTNYDDLFNSEEARIRIGRLVEKQKKAHALGQLKSSTDDRLPVATESHRVDPRSLADLNGKKSGHEKEPTESNNLKRKVVVCQQVPSYKGFSETAAAPNYSQKKEASNYSWNNSSKRIFPAKEENKIKFCETSKEPLNKNSNIQSLNEGKRLIRVHIQQSKQSNSTHQITAKQFHPPHTQPVRSVGRLDRSPPRKYSSPTRPSKVPRIVHETDSNQEPTPKHNDKELSVQKHELLPNQTSGACKESCKEMKPSIRNISKTKKEHKKMSPPGTVQSAGLSSENEDKSRKKTYNQEEIRKYISRKKDEKKKHKHAQQATAIKKKEGKEQTMMLLAHHQREAFQMAKKNPPKSRQEDEVVQKNSPSSSWEEVFAAINNSQKHFAEVKDASVGTNGVAEVQVSTASSYEVSTKVSFATSYTRTTEMDVHSPPDKSKRRSNVRLQKIQESARLLSSRLDFQTTELISYFRGKESNVKSARDASIMTTENHPLPVASSTETDSISQTHLKLHKSQKDVSPSIPSGSVPAFVASSSPTIETHDVQKRRDYFRVPDDLSKLNASLLKEAESSKSTGAVMLEKNVENLPRDMFPSENLRKKLSKKASLSNLENKTSVFDEAKTSKHRLSFGSDSTFDEFNWELIRSFLATEESRLMYQNSMSKIKQQALEDHSKSLSNIAEPSNKTRTFFKRGMDDVYPQSMKKSRNQSLSRSRKDSSEEVSSSCEIYAESINKSEKQMLTDDSESTQPSELFKNVKSKKPHELNLKLGEKMLARKEETLKQRKERLMKLLERLDSLDTTEREVNQMEIELSRRWKNFSDIQQTLDGKSGVNKLALKEIAVQTNTSSKDVFVGGDQESINVSIKHVSQTKDEELINDSVRDEESMKDISHTKDELAEVDKDSKVQGSNNTHTEHQKKRMTKLVGGNLQNEPRQDSPDIFSPACKDLQIDNNVGFDIVTDFSLIFDQVPGFDLNISPETRGICQKISKDSLEMDAENVNKEIKIQSTKSSSEADDDSLKDLAVETNLKESSKISMSSETLCISPDNLELGRLTAIGHEEPLDEVVVESPWSDSEAKENLENHLRAISKGSKPNSERIEQEIQTIDSVHQVDGKATIEVCASARVGFIERSFSCESFVSKDSLTAVISPVLHEVAEEKPNGSIPEGDSVGAHALDSCDSLNATDEHASRGKVSTLEDPELVEIEDISTEKTETTESGYLMKAIESAAVAVQLFSEPNDVDTEKKDTAEKQREGLHLLTENISGDLGSNYICSKNSIITNFIPNEVGDTLDWSKIKLGNFIVKSVAGDLLKDATDAMLDAMKNKKRMLQRKENVEAEEEVKEEAGVETLSDEYIDDDNYAASVPMHDAMRVGVHTAVLPEIYGILKSKEDMTALITESLDIYWNQRRNGEPWENLLPPICFLTKSTTVTPPESIFRTFMFELVGEVLISLYSKEEETAEEDEPQLEIVRSIADFLLFDRKNPIRKGLPNSLEELRPTFIDMILGLLPPRNDFTIARPTTANKLANTMCGKEGRDGHVENLLARELKLEEPDWVNYEKDSESVKNSVADAIFKSLLDDTAASVLLAHSRKINSKSKTFSR